MSLFRCCFRSKLRFQCFSVESKQKTRNKMIIISILIDKVNDGDYDCSNVCLVNTLRACSVLINFLSCQITDEKWSIEIYVNIHYDIYIYIYIYI